MRSVYIHVISLIACAALGWWMYGWVYRAFYRTDDAHFGRPLYRLAFAVIILFTWLLSQGFIAFRQHIR